MLDQSHSGTAPRLSRRGLTKLAMAAGAAAATTSVFPGSAQAQATAADTIKVGLIAELTGPLSFMGMANANVAKLLFGDINASGGLLGRRIELIVEDGATIDAVAEAKATKLIEHDKVDVLFGGIYSSTRQTIKKPVKKNAKLYIYPEQYEGQEADPHVFCTGPVPAQQLEPLIPWLMQTTGAKTFYLPSADYIWPRVLNKKVRELVTANGGQIVGEEYYPLDHLDYRETVKRITASKADVVFNTIVPPGLTPFFEELFNSGFQKRGGKLVCTYFDENFLNLVPASHVEGLYGCLDYYHDVSDPFSRDLLVRYSTSFPGSAQVTAGSACSGLYRGIKLWESAVREAATLSQDKVIAALDHAKIAQGPGGAAEMIPGQNHLRMNMNIAQANAGKFRVVETLGMIEPKEAVVRM